MNCNIAFLGDVGVGKTAIICRMLTGKASVKLVKLANTHRSKRCILYALYDTTYTTTGPSGSLLESKPTFKPIFLRF